jgi:hypothetical protein
LARNRTKVLHELLGKVFCAQNLNEALPGVIAAAAEAIGAQAAALILSPGRSSRHPPPLVVSSTMTFGLPEAALEGKALATELLVSLGMQEAAPVVVEDYPHYVFAHGALVELGVQAVLASPLEVAGESTGLLVLLRISDDRCFGKTDGLKTFVSGSWARIFRMKRKRCNAPARRWPHPLSCRRCWSLFWPARMIWCRRIWLTSFSMTARSCPSAPPRVREGDGISRTRSPGGKD